MLLQSTTWRVNCYTNNVFMSIIANIQTHLDNNKYLTGSFVDLKKAFDVVDHDVPIKELKHYGVRGVTKELAHIISEGEEKNCCD